MTTLYPNTDIGKMRLRCGDFSDMPIMPDAVYVSALADCNGNLPRACVLVCQYILASLTGQTHQKLGQVEVFGAEWFQNYLAFVKLTISNPNLMPAVPIPYSSHSQTLPVEQFQRDWNLNYSGGTEAAQTHRSAYCVTPYF